VNRLSNIFDGVISDIVVGSDGLIVDVGVVPRVGSRDHARQTIILRIRRGSRIFHRHGGRRSGRSIRRTPRTCSTTAVRHGRRSNTRANQRRSQVGFAGTLGYEESRQKLTDQLDQLDARTRKHNFSGRRRKNGFLRCAGELGRL
jgi:hypothetical protein